MANRSGAEQPAEQQNKGASQPKSDHNGLWAKYRTHYEQVNAGHDKVEAEEHGEGAEAKAPKQHLVKSKLLPAHYANVYGDQDKEKAKEENKGQEPKKPGKHDVFDTKGAMAHYAKLQPKSEKESLPNTVKDYLDE